MLSVLGDKERAVIDTITMRFHTPEALDYLENLGMKMGVATYYRYKKKVEDMKVERMQFIAKHFQELHLEKIDRLELIDRLMWQEYEKETQPYRRVKILETIANAQMNQKMRKKGSRKQWRVRTLQKSKKANHNEKKQ
jgi:hypothetical protein